MVIAMTFHFELFRQSAGAIWGQQEYVERLTVGKSESILKNGKAQLVHYKLIAFHSPLNEIRARVLNKLIAFHTIIYLC
jgi:hypothetical protein